MRVRSSAGAAVAVGAVAAAVLTGCGGSSGDSGGTGGGGTGGGQGKAAYGAATTSVVNPSTRTGGVVNYALSSTPDSFDPGNTYYAFVWDSSRLWARALTTFRPLPGKAGVKLQPDLATSLGKVSDGGRTYTYTIRSGLKFSDGTPITSADVKYAVERSNYAPDVLSNGPTYFHAVLKDNPGQGYQGPYKDRTGDLKSIQTPNATTIVFHLAKPFADFDYLVSNPQTAPVPRAKDTGADYVKKIVSSGSYMFRSYDPNKGAVLVRNPNWDPKSDPIRKQYANEIDIKFNQEQTGIDQDLLAGNLTADLAGAGVAASTQANIVNDPSKKAHADDALSGTEAYVALSSKVAPLDNINCRKAVEYAVDKTSAQNSLGGPLRGAIASTVLPPNVVGYTKYDMYPTNGNSGDTAKAKQYLKACGHPDGFSTNLSARGDRPNEVSAAVSLQASLKKVGIRVSVQKFPSGKYFSDYAGAPAFVHQHKLGMMMMAWGSDWPTGYGYLQQISEGSAIKASGNSNLSELDDPKVNDALDTAIQNSDDAARTRAWGQIDKQIMSDAAIVPLTYRLDLLYRPPSATNVTVTPAYGMYDYLNVGTA